MIFDVLPLVVKVASAFLVPVVPSWPAAGVLLARGALDIVYAGQRSHPG